MKFANIASIILSILTITSSKTHGTSDSDFPIEENVDDSIWANTDMSYEMQSELENKFKIDQGMGDYVTVDNPAINNVYDTYINGDKGDSDDDIKTDWPANELNGNNNYLPIDLPGGMTKKQINTTLSLVSVAENSNTNWWKFYSYIENIHDGRGYTISIVGFCTGTGDFLMVVRELQRINPKHPLVAHLPVLRKVKGGNVRGLEGLPSDIKRMGNNDIEFNTAAWRIIQRLYWNPSMKYCMQNGLNSALAKYIVYDTYLNFGELDAFDNLSNTSGEIDFLYRFLNIKQRTIELDPSLGSAKKNRVALQRKLLTQGNLALTLPMTVSCYGDTFTLKNYTE